MTTAEMAALYAAAFAEVRAWSAEEIAALISGPGGFAVTAAAGFALGRAIVGEAELITIAVAPTARRQGTGRALLAAFEAEARAHDADTAFLEVAADNTAALALYRAAGWAEIGRRAAYYARPTGAADALTMAKPLSPR
ncbi:MAG: alanine acetyltransferase [Rhodobacterales bacterium CG2_30_65_12]|nr:MAG: alanine acetyltransferase [Rhodobacterales bacterium CG2_30_65_12]